MRSAVGRGRHRGSRGADREGGADLRGGSVPAWLGQGLQRQHGGGNIFRACAMLPAVTGNFAKPGAGLYYLNGGAMRGIDGDYLSAPRLREGEALSISHMDLAARLEDRQMSRALLSWNMNVAASGPQQARLHRALERDDLFTVVIELFATDTADYADIVLPASSFLEFDDIIMSYFNLSVSAQVKLEEPLGDSLPNQEIFRKLSRAMCYQDPELFETDAAMITTILAATGVDNGAAHTSHGSTLANCSILYCAPPTFQASVV